MNKKLIITILCLVSISTNSFAMLANWVKPVSQRLGTQAATKTQAILSQAKQAAQRTFATNTEQPANSGLLSSFLNKIGDLWRGKTTQVPQTGPIADRLAELDHKLDWLTKHANEGNKFVAVGRTTQDSIEIIQDLKKDLLNDMKQVPSTNPIIQKSLVDINKLITEMSYDRIWTPSASIINIARNMLAEDAKNFGSNSDLLSKASNLTIQWAQDAYRAMRDEMQIKRYFNTKKDETKYKEEFEKNKKDAEQAVQQRKQLYEQYRNFPRWY